MWLVSNLWQCRNDPINMFYLRAAIVRETLLVKWLSGIKLKVTFFPFCGNKSLNMYSYHVITHMIIAVLSLLTYFRSYCWCVLISGCPSDLDMYRGLLHCSVAHSSCPCSLLKGKYMMFWTLIQQQVVVIWAFLFGRICMLLHESASLSSPGLFSVKFSVFFADVI